MQPPADTPTPPPSPAPLPEAAVVFPQTQSSSQTSVPQAPPQTPTPSIPPKPSFPHRKLLMTVITMIILLFAIGIGAYYFAMQQTQMEPIESPIPTDMPIQSPDPTVDPEQTATPEASLVPTPTPESREETVTITSLPNLDGYQSSNGSGNNGAELRIGRNNFLISRGFLAFNLGSIPKNATIQNATLRIYQTGITGSPYTAGLNVRVDHVDYGGSLENDDYRLAPLRSNVATLTSNDVVEWKEVTVTESIRDDLALSRLRAGFRLRFATEQTGGKTGGDFAYFESGENFTGSGNIPQLIITYRTN